MSTNRDSERPDGLHQEKGFQQFGRYVPWLIATAECTALSQHNENKLWSARGESWRSDRVLTPSR
jgi:hypothetical protein